MSEELSFRISTGLKNILGKDLITNRKVAIFELVKNGFDARAKNIDVVFDMQKKQIVIRDNGVGMTPEDIKNLWLFIGYSYKAEQQNELYAGAKGIGRFSTDRLGRFLELYSQKDGIISKLSVDWEAFEQDNRREFFEQRVLLEEIEEVPTFKKKGYLTGTLLKITDLRDDWDKKDIEQICYALEKLINPLEKVDTVSIKVTIIDDTGKSEIKEIKNNIFEILERKTILIEGVISKNRINLTLADNEKIIFDMSLVNSTILEDITIKLFFMSYKAKTNFTRKMGMAVKEYGSIFVYKNNFRIYPFGEITYDAFGLNLRKAQGTRRFLAHRELLGWISIYDNEKHFVEVSSRDNGFIQNKYSIELEQFLKQIVLRPLELYVELMKFGKIEIDSYSDSFSTNDAYNDYFNRIYRLLDRNNLEIIDFDSYELPEVIIPVEEKIRLLGDDTIPAHERIEIQKSLSQNIKNLEAEQKNKDAQLKSVKAEAETLKRQVQIQRKLFVKTPPERQKYLQHEITKSTKQIASATDRIFENLSEEDTEKNSKYRYLIHKEIRKLKSMQKMVLRLEIDTNKNRTEIDVFDVVNQYVCETNIEFLEPLSVERSTDASMIRKINIFEFGIVIDNIIQNAYDQGATFLQVILTNDSKIRFISNTKSIPEEKLEEIFEMGYTTKELGYGIGLYMCRDLLKKVNLKIYARNTYNGVEFVIGDENNEN